MQDKQNNKNIRSTIIALTLLGLIGITGCSQYKSSWTCKNPEGIGCSSIGYADRVARKHIILNDEHFMEDTKKSKAQQRTKKLLINEHYSDFKKQKKEEVSGD
jgi:hypothetical protein